MLVTRGGVRAGSRVLVQGAGGGVATAAIALARGAGATVFATSRDPVRRAKALGLGAHAAVQSGGRLPDRVDVVIETVGRATWSHSLKSLLVSLLRFLEATGVRPVIDDVVPLSGVPDALRRVDRGEVCGKVVVTP